MGIDMPAGGDAGGGQARAVQGEVGTLVGGLGCSGSWGVATMYAPVSPSGDSAGSSSEGDCGGVMKNSGKNSSSSPIAAGRGKTLQSAAEACSVFT